MRDRDKVLVAYATAHGSTRGVAERLTATLGQRELRAEARSVEGALAVGGYGAVVLGSPVYNGRWLSQAEQFVQTNLAALAARPVWLFSVAAFGDRKPLLGPLMQKEPKNIGDLRETLQPRDYRVFAGVIERKQWSRAGRVFFRAFGGHFGDNRAWREIDAWGEDVARALHAR
jgi:menaquinone-dependent protoporphyrinogen oxidase